MDHYTATYSPEDNKLRLYASARLSPEDYAKAKAAGFRWAPKQECFVAPSWSPAREDLLLVFADEIGDENYSPLERSADRAERFEGYREKRTNEATDHAETFGAGPRVFGNQNYDRAQRQAARHDRHRGRALSQWDKAEYWQRRTEGVISSALYRAEPHVRRGRIKVLESELRAIVSRYTPTEPVQTINQRAYSYAEGKYLYDGAAVPHVWCGPNGRGGYWVEVARLPAIEAGCARWRTHYENRLTYERAMLANEGGSAAEIEMEPGGWILGGRRRGPETWTQIQKVNRSAVTGKVVSVAVEATTRRYTRESGYRIEETRPCIANVNVERMAADQYRAPTDEERAAFATAKKEKKAAAPVIPTINPTPESAQQLQDHLNALSAITAKENHRPATPSEVNPMTQAQFTRRRGYENARVREFNLNGVQFKCRVTPSGYGNYHSPNRVIILTDKPQKPISAKAFETVEAFQLV